LFCFVASGSDCAWFRSCLVLGRSLRRGVSPSVRCGLVCYNHDEREPLVAPAAPRPLARTVAVVLGVRNRGHDRGPKRNERLSLRLPAEETPAGCRGFVVVHAATARNFRNVLHRNVAGVARGGGLGAHRRRCRCSRRWQKRRRWVVVAAGFSSPGFLQELRQETDGEMKGAVAPRNRLHGRPPQNPSGVGHDAQRVFHFGPAAKHRFRPHDGPSQPRGNGGTRRRVSLFFSFLQLLLLLLLAFFLRHFRSFHRRVAAGIGPIHSRRSNTIAHGGCVV